MKSVKEAKKICHKIFEDFKMNERYEHSKRVAKLCEKVADDLEVNDKEILIKAAWLHDVGKIIGQKGHHKKEVVKKVLQDIYKYEDEDIDEIAEIIYWHRKKFKPTKMVLKCAILRMCDKLDKFNKLHRLYSEVKDDCDKNLKKVCKRLSKRNKGSEKIERLDAICNEHIKIYEELEL